MRRQEAPDLRARDADNWEAVATLAKEKGCPLAVSGADLEALAELTQKLAAAGVAGPGARRHRDGLSRHAAGPDQDPPACPEEELPALGYPCMAFAAGDDAFEAGRGRRPYVAKYAGIVVIDAAGAEQMLPILTVRQNIYTDPQKPIQVEPSVYEIGSREPRLAAADHDQLLADLLHGRGRRGGQPRAGLHRRDRHRGHVGADALASEKLTPPKGGGVSQDR